MYACVYIYIYIYVCRDGNLSNAPKGNGIGAKGS